MIAVRTGLFGRLLILVPVREIARVVSGEQRIVLSHALRPTGLKRLDAHREVEAVINRLRQLIGPRLKRGGGREMTPEEEVSAEPSAEEPSAEERAGEEPATSEALAEEATEAASAEEPAAEEARAEEEPTV
jgi:hypothetical protein